MDGKRISYCGSRFRGKLKSLIKKNFFKKKKLFQENATVFFSLIKAMAENKYVAIVRKVYSNNNLPRMGVLFPKVKENEVSVSIENYNF